ncbi:ATP-dependent helicase [Candidatus Woesearchaeota archaeon]|nr:ATP-dependent helicase [Candidatus Woesearchaeota archaeon]
MENKISFVDKPSTPVEVETILNPLVRQWFTSKFPSFSQPQLYGVLPIHQRENILVSAPTGATKTLTAFLAILNELVDLSQKKILEDRTYCIYISPLKALNNDIHKNLIEPLKEMEELEKEKLNIRVGVRTGDTSQKDKAAMLKHAPHILITTPESLAIILASLKFREHLTKAEWVIIDEIHALAENKRGTHLALSLEQLQHLCGHIARVGLSATVAPIEEIAQFLVGPHRTCKVVDVQFQKHMDISVLSPVQNLIDTPFGKSHYAMYKLLDELISQHKTTLIFTNTRAATERVVDNLKERFPKKYVGNIGAHHGSLGKRLRFDIEERLRKGELKCVVCSTSLELGIDIGYVDLVVCLGSPKSVARFLQRAGRAGHRLHQTIKARIIVMDRDDLVECACLVKAALERKIDKIHIPTNALDVLAQQIDGMALEQVWNERELYDLIRHSHPYKDLKYEDYSQILNYLAGKFVDLEDRHIYAKIWREDGKIGKKGKLGRVIYMTNIGTIPEETFITVKIGDQTIGMLDEGFLEKLRPGDVFCLGGETYSFKFSRGMVAQVSASVNRPPTVPSWASEMLPLSFDLANEIGKFRRFMLDRLNAGNSKTDVLKFIHDYLYVDDNATEAIYSYCKEQFDYCQILPNDKVIVVEHYTDEKDKKILFHTLFGRRVNDCLSRATAFVIAKMLHHDVELGINDNGFYLSGVPKAKILEAFKILRADKLDMVLEAAIDNTEVYKRRFRHCATRAFMILRNYMGRTKRVGRQQVSSMILMSALKRIDANFCVLREAKRECLQDVMDIDSTKKVISAIENKEIRIVEIETKTPTPFGFSLALQGFADVLKIEDKVEFLRRMHQLVLAKIGKQALPVEDTNPYDDIWQREEEQRQARETDAKVMLLEDARRAVHTLRLPRDYLECMYSLIEGERKGFRPDFLDWVEKLFKGAVPRAVSDNLAKFLKKVKEEIK